MFRRSALRALRAAPQACAQEWCVRPPARRLPPPASTLRRLIPARPAASPLAARPPARGLSSDSQPLREASSTLAELTEDDVGAFYTFSREVRKAAPRPPPHARPLTPAQDEAALLPEGCPALSAEFEAQGGRRLLVRDSLLRARARLQPPGPSLPPAPLVLEGLPGSGKSLLLAQLVAGWRQAGGLALYVPRGRDYTIDSNFYAREGAQPAAWDTPEHAGKLLRSLAAAHGGELERMPQRRAGAAAGAPLAALVAAGTAPGAPPATAVDAALAMLAELRLVPRGEEGQPAVLIAVDELNALSSWYVRPFFVWPILALFSFFLPSLLAPGPSSTPSPARARAGACTRASCASRPRCAA